MLHKIIFEVAAYYVSVYSFYSFLVMKLPTAVKWFAISDLSVKMEYFCWLILDKLMEYCFFLSTGNIISLQSLGLYSAQFHLASVCLLLEFKTIRPMQVTQNSTFLLLFNCVLDQVFFSLLNLNVINNLTGYVCSKAASLSYFSSIL